MKHQIIELTFPEIGTSTVNPWNNPFAGLAMYIKTGGGFETNGTLAGCK